MTHHNLHQIHIQFHNSSWNCECCGGIYDRNASVTIDGVDALELSHDGHFGGGDWNGNNEDIYLKALNYLGYKLEVTYFLDVDGDNQKTDNIDGDSLAYYLENFTFEGDKLIKLDMFYRYEEYDSDTKDGWDVPKRGVFTLADGSTHTLEYGKNWQGSWDDFFLFTLSLVALVSEEETSESEDYHFDDDYND